jgi:uncharacterized RDD family membrane protein YckC
MNANVFCLDSRLFASIRGCFLARFALVRFFPNLLVFARRRQPKPESLMQIHIAKNGQRMGPYSDAQVREMLAAGSIAGSDLAWYEGMAGWKPVSEVLPAGAAPVTGAPPVVGTPPVATPAGAPLSPVVRPIDPNLAARGSRLLAVLIDGFLFGLCCTPGLIVMFAGDSDNDTPKIIGGIIIGIAFLALLAIQIYLLTTRGQTIGKKVMSVRIVKYADDSNPGFVHACLLRLIVPGLINGIPLVGSVFPIVDACFIFGEERRCIHDLIAGTKVINA